MMKQVVVSVLGVLCATIAVGQVPGAKPTKPVDVSLFGGYSRSLGNVWRGAGNGYGGENGFEVGADISDSRWLAVTGDLAGYFSSYDGSDSSRFFRYAVGPKFKFPTGSSPMKPYVDVLVGGAHVSYFGASGYTPFKTTSSFTFGADGGLDYFVGHNVAIRAQAGYFYASFNANDSEVQKNIPTDHIRVSTGVVYRFR